MAAESAHEIGEAAGGAHALFPPFDPHYFPSQLLWLAITFICFYFVMKNVALPRIGGIVADRQGRISGDLAAAERLKAETDDAIAAYEQALAEARGRAFKIAEDANQKSSAEAAKSRAATEAELASKLAAAESRIGEIKAKALADVGAIAGETAEAVVTRLIGGSVDKGAVASAVSTAMAEKGPANVG